MLAQFIRNSLALLTLSVGVLVFNGCDSGTQVTEAEPSAPVQTPTTSQITPSVEKQQTTSVAATKSNEATSPASNANKLPDIDTPPAEICKRFMELLKSGNRMSAENLLTAGASATTSKAGLQLEPMGGPTSRYELGETRFATIKQKIAHVKCAIVEPTPSGESVTTITWMLRKQKLGWRVAGMLVDLNGSNTPDLLSFETIADVERIKMLASAEVIDESNDSRQAAADETKNLK